LKTTADKKYVESDSAAEALADASPRETVRPSMVRVNTTHIIADAMAETFDRQRWYECARCGFRSEPGDPTTMCPRCGDQMRNIGQVQE
jgi:rubrerythrin